MDVRPSTERVEDLVESAGQLRQIAVVDGASVELVGQLIEDADLLGVPRTGRCRRRLLDRDLNAMFDHLDRRAT